MNIPSFKLFRVMVEGFSLGCTEIADIQPIRPQAEAIQRIGILEDVIQKNAVLPFRQCCLAQEVIPVVKCHDQINPVIKGQRMRLTIVPVVLCCPLAMAHIQPVILAAGVMENRSGTQRLPLFLG